MPRFPAANALIGVAKEEVDALRHAYIKLRDELRRDEDRILKVVEGIARKHGPEEAKQVLKKHTAYILEQAIR